MKFKKSLAIFVIFIIGFGISGMATATTFNDEVDNGLKIWFGPFISWYKEPIEGKISVTTDKGSYPIGEEVFITIKNNGDNIAYTRGGCSPIWNIEKRQSDGSWKQVNLKIHYLIPNPKPVEINPGEVREYKWEVSPSITNSGVISGGDYRVSFSYYVKEEKYEFTEYCYFYVSNIYIEYKDSIKIKEPESCPIEEPKSIKIKPPESISIENPKIEHLKVKIAELPKTYEYTNTKTKVYNENKYLLKNE